jgi:sodium/pantothenate symporter
LLPPLGLIIYGTGMPFWLLNYYVIPYQVGTGEILPDGSINWATGEALIVLTVFIVHVPLALMAMKVTWNRYNPQSKRNQKILYRARLKESTAKR